MRAPSTTEQNAGAMGQVLNISTITAERQNLIARLVRQVCVLFDPVDDPSDILRACIGAALAHDLTDPETYALIGGVEEQLGLWLTPMARIA